MLLIVTTIKEIGVAFSRKFNKCFPRRFDIDVLCSGCFQIRMEVLLSLSELESLTSRYSSESGRGGEGVGDQINQILQTLDFHLSSEDTDRGERQQALDECMRCLRNSVAGAPRNQIQVGERILLERSSLTDYIKERITRVRSDPSESEFLSLRLGLQLIANLLVGQERTQRHFLDTSLSVIQEVLSLERDDKTLNTAAMIVHIFLTNEEMLSDQAESFHARLSEYIPPLSSQYKEDCVWVKKCLEQFFRSEDYLQHLNPEQRAVLTSILPFPPEERVVNLLVTDFTFLTDIHLLITGMTSKVSTVLEAHDILSLTEFLTKCSGLEEFRQTMQSNKSLVINTVSLLKLVHQAAKTDEGLRVLGKLRL